MSIRHTLSILPAFYFSSLLQTLWYPVLSIDIIYCSVFNLLHFRWCPCLAGRSCPCCTPLGAGPWMGNARQPETRPALKFWLFWVELYLTPPGSAINGGVPIWLSFGVTSPFLTVLFGYNWFMNKTDLICRTHWKGQPRCEEYHPGGLAGMHISKCC